MIDSTKFSLEQSSIVERAEKYAKECEHSLHDAIFEVGSDRRFRLLSAAKVSLRKLEGHIADNSWISCDTSNFQTAIRIVEKGDYFFGLESIRELVGNEEFDRIRAESLKRNDFLGQAASFASEALEKKFLGDRDGYWAAKEKQKDAYLRHANAQNWGHHDTLRLYSTVYRDTADFLRQEGRHKEALRHYLYFLSHSHPASESSLNRLPAFLKRAQLPVTELPNAVACYKASEATDNFEFIDRFLTQT